MIIKIHFNALKHLDKLVDASDDKSKVIRIKSNGSS